MNFLIVPLIFLGVFSILFWAYRERNLRSFSFEITPSNKDREKGLEVYREEIFSFLKSLRYIVVDKGANFLVFRPRPLQRIMGGNVKVSWDPYIIKIEGPKYIVLIISEIVEISTCSDESHRKDC